MRYSRMKIFHYPEKLASLPEAGGTTLPPLHLRIKPTNVCGHRCRYCSYRNPGLQLGSGMERGDSIPRDRILEIMDDVVTMGVRAVTFSGGGDPFCYPYLGEAAERLAASPVRFAALTNGARLEGDAAAIFARSASWVRISLDGWDAASYARYRGVSETEFGRVLENMRRFRGLGGGCHLGVSLIIDHENAPHVHELIGLVRSAGADSVKVSPCVVSDDAVKANAYHEPFYEQVVAQVEAARRDTASDAFEIHSVYHPHETAFDKAYGWCPYVQILTVIGADLGVYACQDKAYNRETGLLGSLEHMRFRDFWLSHREKFFTIHPSRDCNHHCVADGKNCLVLDYLDAGGEHGEFV